MISNVELTNIINKVINDFLKFNLNACSITYDNSDEETVWFIFIFKEKKIYLEYYIEPKQVVICVYENNNCIDIIDGELEKTIENLIKKYFD